MKKPHIATLISSGYLAALMVGCLVFVLVFLLIRVLWAWTIPDLFPGAVEQGLVAGRISWATAVKLALFIAVLSGIAGHGGTRVKRD